MRTAVRDFLTPLSVVFLAGVVAYDHFGPCSRSGAIVVVDGVKLGRAYAPSLAQSMADGWLAAADSLEAGKGVGDAQEALQATFKAARVRAFTALVAPEFAKVLPEGAEPRDANSRAEVARLWRGFARGLKGGR